MKLAGILARRTAVESRSKKAKRPPIREAAQLAAEGIAHEQGHKVRAKRQKRAVIPPNPTPETSHPSQSNLPPVPDVSGDAQTEAPSGDGRRVRSIHCSHYHSHTHEKNFDFTQRRPPIYLFYRQVGHSEKGTVGVEGDKHYRCYHSDNKILTVTKLMKSSQTGLFAYHILVATSLIGSHRWNTSALSDYPRPYCELA